MKIVRLGITIQTLDVLVTCWYIGYIINSLRHSDVIWQHRSWSTLAQAMAYRLAAQSHYQNQCWFRYCNIHLIAISQQVPKLPFCIKILNMIRRCKRLSATLQVAPLLMQWIHCSLVLSHRYDSDFLGRRHFGIERYMILATAGVEYTTPQSSSVCCSGGCLIWI